MREATLANGVELLVVERPGALTVAAGWMVGSGSAVDPASRPGLAHLLEHLLFQGTETVGTRDWERERELLAREERLRDRIRRAREARDDRSGPSSGPPDPSAIAGDLGIREELRRLRRERRRITVPGELTLALVGAVDLPTATELAKRYFGRLEVGAGEGEAEEPIPAPDPDGLSRVRPVEATCPGRPRLAVVYPTVAFDHEERPALDLLASILNGRTGRLHREIVLRKDAAWSAYAVHRPLARAGELWFRAEVAPGERPLSVLPHWDAVVTSLEREAVGEEELERARDHLRVETYRGLREPRGLLTQLLIYQGLGGWRGGFRTGDTRSRVTPERVRSAVRRFLDPESRRVGVCAPSGVSP